MGRTSRESSSSPPTPWSRGFTTNPTLMRKAGIEDYEGFARKVLDHVTDRPISFEVCADDFDEMRRQAHRLSSWGPNVYVKIPVTNTEGDQLESSHRRPHGRRSAPQRHGHPHLGPSSRGDSSHCPRAPVPWCPSSRVALRTPAVIQSRSWRRPSNCCARIRIWSCSGRVHVRSSTCVRRNRVGCHIITVTHDLLKKLGGLGRSLEEVSLDTVRMFYRDAVDAGYLL